MRRRAPVLRSGPRPEAARLIHALPNASLRSPFKGRSPSSQVTHPVASTLSGRSFSRYDAGVDWSERIAANLAAVNERIRAACSRVGRDPAEITIVAVTKTHPPEVVQAAAACGLRVFGENRVQEAKAKIPHCPSSIHWHLIGHLQTNKVRDAVALFEMIQSVDSLRVAEEIQRRAEQAGRRLPVLLEVNVAGEASKFGYSPERLLEELGALNALPRLEIQGLMTVPPWSEDPERVRPWFRKLRELKAACEDRLGAPLPHLSMGMSQDFQVAVEEGATMVRLGTVLFGPRTSIVRAAAEKGADSGSAD